jgi:hypothetical protein
LRKIFSKENVKDLEESLRKLILKLVNEFKPLRIIATSSLARGEFVRGLSGIDILMVVDYQIPKDKRFILTNIEDVDIEITIVLLLEELERTVKEGNRFYIEALEHGITVYTSTQDYG